MGSRASVGAVRAVLGFVAWMGFLGAVLGVALWAGRFPALQIQWGHLELWLGTAAPGDIAAAILRQAVVVCAACQILMSLLYLVARLTRIPAAIRAVEWATLPITRRLVHRVVVVSMAASMVAPAGMRVGSATPVGGPVMADAPPVEVIVDEETGSVLPWPNNASTEDLPVAPETQPVETPPPEATTEEAAAECEETDQREEVTAGEASDIDPGPAPPTTSPPETDESAGLGSADASTATTYVVVPGDNLWTIAAAHLGSQSDPAPSTTVVARYWRAVIDANLGRLRSGDPNLIYPGEELTLPPVGVLEGDGARP